MWNSTGIGTEAVLAHKIVQGLFELKSGIGVITSELRELRWGFGTVSSQDRT